MMDEKTLSIALLQLSPRQTEREALEVGLAKCREAKDLHAEIVLFPEMWNVGYRLPSGENEVEAWKRNAIDEGSPFVQSFREIARELRIIVAITYLEKTDGLPRNSVAVIDKGGTSPTSIRKSTPAISVRNDGAAQGTVSRLPLWRRA